MIRSSGIVIVRKLNSRWQYLFLRAYHYWDFPKGKVEEGEELIETAVRETREESGITDLAFNWGNVFTETDPYGKKKKIARYYLAETTQEKVTLNYNEELGKPEHNEYRWIQFGALKKLACPRILQVAKWAKTIIEGSK